MKLFAREQRWAKTIGETLIPASTFGGLAGTRDIGREMARHALESPWYLAIVLRLSLWLTWLSPLWVLGRARTFGGLDEAARLACLESLLKSNRYLVRQLLLVLKMSICMAVIGCNEVLARIGAYDLARPAALDRRAQ